MGIIGCATTHPISTVENKHLAIALLQKKGHQFDWNEVLCIVGSGMEEGKWVYKIYRIFY